MKKKLVFVATTPFAVNAFLRTHLQALAQDYDITLCVNTAAYPLLPEIERIVHVHAIPIARAIAPWTDLRTLWLLWRLLRQVRPDAVHSITPKAGLLAMLAAMLAGVPRRWHTFTGQVWVTKRGAMRHLLKTMDWLLARCATHVFADSASQCRLLERERIVVDGAIGVLGPGSICGVDLDRFQPCADAHAALRAECNCPGDATVFLYLGRLARDKGVFDLIAAFAAIAEQLSNAQLWIVGPDEEGLLAQLQERSQPWRNQVRWFGATAQPEKYMQAADIFVLASYREGFGSVILEAAACGLPSLAYRIDGVVDAVVDGQTGVLVPLRNTAELSAAMEHLYCADDVRSMLGRNALTRAREQFSCTVVTAAWSDFYRTSINQEK